MIKLILILFFSIFIVSILVARVAPENILSEYVATNYNSEINTEFIMKVKQYPTQKEINNLFYYDNGKLFWKACYQNQLDLSREAGYSHPFGYKHIKIKNITYKRHRLIWIMFMGNIPKDLAVDHIDERKSNDCIENLRLLTPTQNAHRGARGYSWHEDKKKWCARIGYLYNIIHLGNFDKEEDARNVYLEARMLLHNI